jgi:eukaryotic-like serine/threonine-protein kinase
MKSHWQTLKKIFSNAIELEGEQREKYIREACKNNPHLMEEVQSLLAAHDTSGPLDQSLDHIKQSALSDADFQSMKGRKIGPYKIMDTLGRGGMGNVYLAERDDNQFTQKVALKLLANGFTSENQTKRFFSERQILASLNHENIAQLHDGGITAVGQPWFAMEHVKGKPINEFCNDNQLSINDRLKIFISVCKAVQYAHRNLVIHRDLKPSNILVTDEGTVKLLDFGIAKVLNSDELSPDSTPLTQTGLLPLTPAYASPEQVKGKSVTTASDIYQLGIVLYELLTGCRPYEVSGHSPSEIEEIICEQTPTKPSTIITKTSGISISGENLISDQDNKQVLTPKNLRKELKGDLDTVILKALRKEPERRYESAEQLASDIHRYLSNEPVIAHPNSKFYRAKKFVSRHTMSVISSAAIILLLIGYAVTITTHSQRTQTALHQAQQETERAEQALGRAEALQSFLLDLFRSAEPDRPADQMPRTEEILALGAERAMNPESSPPAERFEMLLAIAGVYSYHATTTQSEILPLMTEAVELARNEQALNSDDLARALQQKAHHLLFVDQNIDRAEELLQEAQLLTEHEDISRKTNIRVAISYSWLAQFKGNPDQALHLLESFTEPENTELDDTDTRAMLYDRLASLYRNHGRLEESSHFRAMATEQFKTHHGPESRPYAVSLANSVGLERDLGRYTVAENNARKAIELYNQIYQEPRDYRASVRLNLARTFFSMGRSDEAFEELEKSSTEWAKFLNQDPDNWLSHYITSGYFHMRMNDTDKALQDYSRLRDLVEEQDTHNNYIDAASQTWLAWVYCQSGDSQSGLSMLQNVEQGNGIKSFGHPRDKASFLEIKAVCYYQNERAEAALEHIIAAIEEFDVPGQLFPFVQRRILHADILVSLDRYNEASEILTEAEQHLHELYPSNHPLMEEIQTARQDIIASVN